MLHGVKIPPLAREEYAFVKSISLVSIPPVIMANPYASWFNNPFRLRFVKSE